MLRRAAWTSLDGSAGFAFDDADKGLAEHWWDDPARFPRTIRLPFPPESRASGIGDTAEHPVVWYHIELTPQALRTAGYKAGRRLLLHFGGVDHEATVWVDGVQVAHHEGGQTAFCADITDALTTAGQERRQESGHRIVVRATDDPHDRSQPRGKQTWAAEPARIWYGRSTGIWRPVWMESVPQVHLARLSWQASPSAARVQASLEFARPPQAPVPVHIRLTLHGEQIAEADSQITSRMGVVDIALPPGRDLSWSPSRPWLLDATISAGEDEVTSYLGVRDVEVQGRQLCINGEPVFLRQVLEQCYWPESLYTAPGGAALKAEAELVAELGFNGMRIHQQTPDPRLLYWADRLGLLVFAEIGAAHEFTERATRRLQREWSESVRANLSHPCIICWVPVNESWGFPDLASDPLQSDFISGLAGLTRVLDPTRPVLSNDGWEHTDSDLVTIHDYSPRPRRLIRHLHPAAMTALLEGTLRGEAGRFIVIGEHQRSDLPVLLDEFGGIRFESARRTRSGWGYSTARTRRSFQRKLRSLVDTANSSGALAGWCWTQLTDVRQETNGLCDESRHPKLQAEILRSIFGHR